MNGIDNEEGIRCYLFKIFFNIQFVYFQVKYAPKVTVTVLSGMSPSGRISEGSEVRLGCKADANPSDVSYKWFMNDDPIIGDFTTELVRLLIKRFSYNRKLANFVNRLLISILNLFLIFVLF